MKFMRIVVFFDLPVKEKDERREATQFRQALLKDGYFMMQYSVYTRICSSQEAVEKHIRRLHTYLPTNGSIRALVVTEKQFERMHILLGKLTYKDYPEEIEGPLVF